MSKIITLLLFSYGSMFSQQNTATYDYGHNGMELVATKSNETVIINNFNAKMTIREDIAEKLLDLYNANGLITDTDITVIGDEAKVNGKIIIQKKDKLTSVNFYYEKVEWNSGLTEVYKKP
ncbi:hypothetical protein ACI6PS_07390 [Flavobacterium sp. PLA-1-15]|uniref:hypothetical protein n=1 Tax=Flavobacterium sp. PLA-1-15 TaxID=3380533 RepID=UPI003B7E57F8